MRKVDLNADMGESTDRQAYDLNLDLSMLAYVSSINIACGYHAGDPHTMHLLVEAALEKGVAIGAHPSFQDRENFGRKEIIFTPSQVYDLVLYQVGALHAFLHVYGSRLHHIKPHGALYNMAAKDRALADAIALAIQEFDNSIILYAMSGSEMIRAAEAHGLKTCSEVFADRSYQDDGSLTARSIPGALITDTNAAVSQVLMMLNERKVNSLSGKTIPIKAETICLHSDNSEAVAFAAAISDQLKSMDVIIQQP